MGQLDVGLRLRHEEEMGPSSHFSQGLFMDGASASRLLDALTSDANCKHTCTPFLHWQAHTSGRFRASSCPGVHVIGVWEDTGEPGENPDGARTFWL